jgi:MFS family permease
MFLVGRLISGYGVGLIVSLIPVYQSEIAPASERGFLGASHGIFIVTGYVSKIPCHSLIRIFLLMSIH